MIISQSTQRNEWLQDLSQSYSFVKVKQHLYRNVASVNHSSASWPSGWAASYQRWFGEMCSALSISLETFVGREPWNPTESCHAVLQIQSCSRMSDDGSQDVYNDCHWKLGSFTCKKNIFTGLKQGWNESTCWYMQRLSTVGHGQSFFIFRLLFHMSARQAQLSKGTKSVTVVCFFNPRSMKLPATFQPLFTGGEFSHVLWHTERGMSRIYLHSHPFQLGTLNFWGDFRWVWICGGIVLRSLKVYFAACLGMLMKQPTVSFPISMGSNDFHMIPGHSANFQLSQLRFAKVKQAKGWYFQR